MAMLRSLVFLVVFYVNTALFLVLGGWLLLAPRRWAMEGGCTGWRACGG